MGRLIRGTDGNDTLVARSGDTLEALAGNNSFSISAYRFTGNVFRGGDGDDSYMIRYGGFGQAGSRIEDSGGQDTLTIESSLSPGTPIDLNLDGFLAGVVG
ncbi:MAG: hypothetical protein RPC23_14900, partial [Limnospira fusiformis LS22]|nr:hypothetical protein [Limnospira fusiformis LS22]